MSAILLTRPQARAQRLKQQLEAGGHTVLNVPVTVIGPTNAPLPEGARRCTGLIVTSAAAVPRLADIPKHLPCHAVGPVTADALRSAGWQDVTAYGGEISALKTALADRPGRWLYPCGRDVAHEPGSLASDVLAWPVYEAKPLPPWPGEMRETLAAFQPDWTVFLSQRTAILFAEQIQKARLWQGGAPGAAALISPALEDAVAPLGYKTIVIAPEKMTSSLVAAMALS